MISPAAAGLKKKPSLLQSQNTKKGSPLKNYQSPTKFFNYEEDSSGDDSDESNHSLFSNDVEDI